MIDDLPRLGLGPMFLRYESCEDSTWGDSENLTLTFPLLL